MCHTNTATAADNGGFSQAQLDQNHTLFELNKSEQRPGESVTLGTIMTSINSRVGIITQDLVRCSG